MSVIGLQALMKHSKQLPFAVENSFNARIGLLKRSATEEGVQWYDVGRPAGWAAHVANAWEDRDGRRVHIVFTQCGSISAANGYLSFAWWSSAAGSVFCCKHGAASPG